MNDHLQNECLFRPYVCEHCKQHRDTYHAIAKSEGHYGTCPNYPVKCPLKCGKTVQRKDVHNHIAGGECQIGSIMEEAMERTNRCGQQVVAFGNANGVGGDGIRGGYRVMLGVGLNSGNFSGGSGLESGDSGLGGSGAGSSAGAVVERFRWNCALWSSKAFVSSLLYQTPFSLFGACCVF